MLQEDIFLCSSKLNFLSLSFSHKVFLKSFLARLKAVRDVLYSSKKNSFITDDLELLRVLIFIKSYVFVPNKDFFFIEKANGTSFLLYNFGFYDASFFNLLLMSYLPFFEFHNVISINDKFSNGFRGNTYSYISNLFSSYSNFSLNVFLKISLVFTFKNINWFLKNFPFNKTLLKSYLFNNVFEQNKNFSFYKRSFLWFNYDYFNLLLFSYVTNSLVCIFQLTK